MGRIATLLLIAFLPAVAVAQSPGDTVEVVIPQDRNCEDFTSQQDAQGWYDAMEIIYAQEPGNLGVVDDLDPHGLDADADGQPCESIPIAKKEWFYPDSAAADTLNISPNAEIWIEYELRPARVSCGGVPETFRVDDFLDQTLYSVDNWNKAYLEYIDKAECIHMIGVLKDGQ